MFDSGILDIVIGIAFVFLSISLICTAVREGIETIMKSRAMDLERGLRELLDDQDGKGLVKELFDHPRIFGLFSGNYDPAKLTSGRGKKMSFRGRRNLPSYIPAAQFSAALLDLVVRKSATPGDTYEPPPLSVENLRSAAASLENDRVKRAILSVIDMAEDDISRVRTELENWFNGTMDRVSGWYKRRTQLTLLMIGLAAAVVLNIDAITITQRLGQDETLRKAVVAMAETTVAKSVPGTSAAETRQTGTPIDGMTSSPQKVTAEGQPQSVPSNERVQAPKPAANGSSPIMATTASDITRIRGQLADIGLPIGWERGWPAPQRNASCPTLAANCFLSPGMWMQIVIGWLITAFAVMLGAPFWFDLLNKFMVIRSTVKPHEKSPEEASEDRQVAKMPRLTSGDGKTPEVTSKRIATVGLPPSDFEPNKWKTDNANEQEAGII